ncbi:hypothetical protein FRC00_010001 [Tulasnella sp. 408]|nr:hypothetical protein FRC00_010001 [Tulasnella sp. 408]
MPTERFALTYSKLGKEYGPITWLVVPGQNIVLLNTYESMKELLEKRGSKYMDRPRGVMLQDLVGELRTSLGETISELTYGVHKDDQGNDYVVKQEELLVYSTLASAGYLVDILPLLRYVPSWFPGAQFKRDAQLWRQHMMNLRKLVIDGVQKRMAANEGRSCYVANMLEELQKLKDETGADITEDIQAVFDSGFSFYQAAADTVNAFLLLLSIR